MSQAAPTFGTEGEDFYLIKTDSLGNVGVAEENRKPHTLNFEQTATVLSGASGVLLLASSAAYDAMGRRALHPRPGVYFLRTQTPAAPRKVLLVE